MTHCSDCVLAYVSHYNADLEGHAMRKLKEAIVVIAMLLTICFSGR